METLLAHSFDYLSSYEPSKVRKGLRQVEGLLAQICLSKSKSANDRRRSYLALEAQPVPKELCELRDDPAFREFFKLQESFQWNGRIYKDRFDYIDHPVNSESLYAVAMRLVSCLEHLLGRGSNGTNDMLIVCTLDLIQGALLLHPPSRTLFAREIYMNLLLDLLDPINCPAIQSATLLTLVTALLDCPANTRTFEDLDGLLTITSLFKQRGTSREVKLKLVEFLYFYLMPETPILGPGASPPGLQRSPSKLSSRPQSSHASAAGGGKMLRDTRTTDEKQALLGRYLNNVEDLVEDLKETAPFGATVF
ncbi:hypothetical protein PENDEC_c001G06743 [Penicillium decumbens]|uniref:Cell division control protein 14 n=1 Tax=Penicillium decumbens TaxID=69771 RepID=A0A1V6PMY8_PENDC|nr:hypothetical protein PENDEC_c001G06743 [Penicillium decumbens]